MAVQTVYFVIHTKSDLLARAIDDAVMGKVSPRPPEEQPGASTSESGGVFNGARGNDMVNWGMWDGGTFHGGPGRDSAKDCDSTNTLTSVEVRIRDC